MKALKHHTILYDDECPMCSKYTNAFVKTGMLDHDGRKAYTELVSTGISNIDWQRARNEIALINRNDHSVQYGVDSLMTIIGHSFPILQPLFHYKPFYAIMRRLYFFISYNRKVMAPGKVFEGANTCTPDMNYSYRWLYILFAWLVTSLILVFYSKLAVPLVPETNFIREFLVCGGQILFQGIIVFLLRRDRLIQYLGNVMTVSLIGAILLCPMFVFQLLIQSNWFFIGYFVLVVTYMFFEHWRRVRILELSSLVSVTWVLYRFLALVIIFIE